jgi:hypothetical protein
MSTLIGGLGGLLAAIALVEGGLLCVLVAASVARSRRSARVARTLAALESASEERGLRLPAHLGRDLTRELLGGPPERRGQAVSVRAAVAGRALAAECLRALLVRRHYAAQTENALGLLSILRSSALASEADVLARALSSRDPALQVHAAAVLGSRAARLASLAPAVADVIRQGSGLGRLTLTWALREMMRAEPGFIAQHARDPRPAIRRAAFAAAASWSARAESRAYAEWLGELAIQGLSDADERVRVLACALLPEFPSPAGIEALARTTTRGSTETRAAAASALAAIGSEDSVMALATALRKAGPNLVPLILEALSCAPGPPPAALAHWLGERDAESALAAVRAVGAIRGGFVLAQAVVPFLRHQDATLRAEAARACGRFLCELPPGETVRALLSALGSRVGEDEDLEVVGALGRALALSGDARAAEPLLAAIATASPAAREALIESLALLELLRARPAARLRGARSAASALP